MVNKFEIRYFTYLPHNSSFASRQTGGIYILTFQAVFDGADVLLPVS